jgi:hypothetical protein
MREDLNKFCMLVCPELRPSASSADSPIPGSVPSPLPQVKSLIGLLFAASRLSPRPIILSVFHQCPTRECVHRIDEAIYQENFLAALNQNQSETISSTPRRVGIWDGLCPDVID